MKKILFVCTISCCLLFLSLPSCQKASDKNLKDCSKECKEQLNNAVSKCSSLADEMEATKCKFKEMTNFNICVQKCNSASMGGSTQ